MIKLLSQASLPVVMSLFFIMRQWGIIKVYLADAMLHYIWLYFMV